MGDRTRVYVDGFNLFYGCLKGTRYRWLDITALCRRELPRNDLRMVRYFSAPIVPAPHKPHAAQNQQTYFRALGTLPGVQVHLGHFLTKRTQGYLVDPSTGQVTKQLARIEVPEEKGTDVNIATYLLLDGMWDMYDVAVIISNDTDLAGPIEVVRSSMGLRVGVLSPFPTVSFPLTQAATFYRPIRRKLLPACQLPPSLADATGVITKPPNW